MSFGKGLTSLRIFAFKNIAEKGTKMVMDIVSFSQVFYLFLTLYLYNPTFNDYEKVAFWKHCEKRRICWKPASSPFPTVFSTPTNANFEFSVSFIISPSKTGRIMGSPMADGRAASISLSGAYLQNYTSYGYEISCVDRSYQGECSAQES